MNSPLNVFSSLSIWLVSLICVPLAALLLLAPLHRLIVPKWPVAIEEHSFSDGTTRLMQASDTHGLLRSRPLSAAVLDLSTGQSTLGYVVAIRAERLEQAESDTDGTFSLRLPEKPHWRIADLPVENLSCTLALSQPGQSPSWLSCETVQRVVLPNQLSVLQKLEVALARLENTDSDQENSDQRSMDDLETQAQEQPEVSD